MEIELLKEKDILRTCGLIREVVNDLKFYSKEAKKKWISCYSPKEVISKVKKRDWIMIVAKDNDVIVGFSDAWIEGNVARSDWSCIKKGYRRMGIGTAIFKLKEEECAKRGCHKIQSDTRTNNIAGMAFLKSMGFKIEAFLKRHWFDQDYYLWYKFIG